MSLLLYSKTITDVLSLKIPYDFHISLPYIMSFDIEVIHQRIQTTHSYVSHCHHYNYCHYCIWSWTLYWYTCSCAQSCLKDWRDIYLSNEGNFQWKVQESCTSYNELGFKWFGSFRNLQFESHILLLKHINQLLRLWTLLLQLLL